MCVFPAALTTPPYPQAADLGDITRGGYDELYAQGFRLGTAVASQLNSTSLPLHFDSTFKTRAQDSRDAFIDGLSAAADAAHVMVRVVACARSFSWVP